MIEKSTNTVLLLIYLLFNWITASPIPYDASSPLELTKTLSGTGSPTFIAIITKKSIRVGDTFSFENLVGPNPRIFMAKKFNSVGTVTIPPLFVPAAEDLTFHYAAITSSTTPTVTYSPTTRVWDFPKIGDDFIFGGTYSSIPNTDQQKTHINTLLLEHDLDKELYCACSLTFSGMLRGIYFNDNYRGQYNQISTPATPSSISQQFTVQFKDILIKKNEVIIVNMIGYRLKVVSLSMVNCKDGYLNGNAQSPTFSYYSFHSTPASPPDTYSVIAPTGSCPPYASRCYHENWALKCQEGYFRYDHVCQPLCNNTLNKITPDKNNDCTTVLPGQRVGFYLFLENYATTSSEHIKATLDIDTPPNTRILFQQLMMSVNAWGAFNLPYRLPSVNFMIQETSTYIGSPDGNGIMYFDINTRVQSNDPNFRMNAFILNDDPLKNLMIHIFTAQPTTNPELLQNGLLNSYGSLNSIFTYPSQRFTKISTYLDCPNSCKISFYTKGHIILRRNERTILFDYDMGTVPTNITLSQIFTGLTFISFYLTNSGIFALYLDGLNAKAITHGYVFAVMTVPITNPSLPTCNPAWNCESCLEGVCLSCLQGYYLGPLGTCISSCPSGYLINQAHRTCESTCPIGTVQSSPTECSIQCSDPGKYFIPGQGCVGDCPPGCLACGNSTVCIQCHPLDSKISGNCVTNSYIQISGSESISSCTDQVFTASIRPEEEQYLGGGLSFVWYISSSTSTNQAKLDALSQLAASVKAPNLLIPASLLEPDQTYTISCSFVNYVSMTISASLTATTGSDLIPTLMIDGNAVQRIHLRDKNTLLKTFVQYSNCLSPSEPLTIEWTQLSGPTLDLPSLVNPQVPLWLHLPNCSLSEDSSYEFQIEAKVTNYPEFASVAKIKVVAPFDKFYAQMNYGNRGHPFTQDLTLTGNILYEIDCLNIDNSGVTYTWQCKVAQDQESEFNTCSDPDNIFNIPMTTQNFVIPSSYFDKDQILQITLIVTKDSRTASQTTKFSILGSRAFIIEVSCTNSNGKPCITWNLDSTITLSANLQGEGYNPLLIYEWSIDPPTQVISYQNILRVLANPSLSYSEPSMRVDVSVRNKTQAGDAFTSVAINTPPQNGIIEASPLIGESLSTFFYVNTYNWTDEDTPLTYQFYYSYDMQNDYAWRALSTVQNLGYISTYLTAQSPSQNVSIMALVFDSFQYPSRIITNVTVVVSSSSLQESLLNMNDLLDSLSPNDPYQNLQVASHITSELANWESRIQEDIENGEGSCPKCSLHGSCPVGNNTCICDSGWTLPDCSLSQDIYDRVIVIRQEAISVLNESYNTIQTNEMREILLNSLQSFSNSPLFNTIDTLQDVQNILESTLGIGNGTLLTEQESRIVANITNNLLQFAMNSDCNCDTAYCKQLENATREYLDEISQSSLQDKIPGEPPTIIETDLFDVVTTKATTCTISDLSLNAGSDTPEVRLSWDDPTNLNCSQELAIKLYAFRSPGAIFNCDAGDSSSNLKPNTMIQIIDVETGVDITSEIKVHLTMPGSLPCPPGCIQGSPCRCSLSLFDVKAQMAMIFSKSELGKLVNIGSLADWEWEKSPMFWFNIAMALSFGIMIVLVKTTLKSTCIFQELIYKHVKFSTRSALSAAFIVISLFFI